MSPQPDGLLEVGHVGRAHGVKGDVFLVLSTDRVERAAAGSKLWVRDQWMTITASSNASGKWRVHLDGVEDRTTAEALAGVRVHAEPIDDHDVLWIHRLIGAQVVSTDGVERGTCASVIENPASDLLELDDGSLVPATFVTDFEDGVVTIDPPDGLFELNG